MVVTQVYNKGFSPLCPKCGDIMTFHSEGRHGLASNSGYDNWMCDSDGYCICFAKSPRMDKRDIVYWKEQITYGWSERTRKEIDWVNSDGDVPAKITKAKKEMPKVECFVCNKSVTSIKTHINKEHPWLK